MTFSYQIVYWRQLETICDKGLKLGGAGAEEAPKLR